MKAAPPTTNPTASAHRARTRAATYGLLARLFRHEPDRQLVDCLRRPEVLRHLNDAGLDLDDSELLDSGPELLVEKLANDYVTLFLLPGNKIPLNESAHRQEEGFLVGESTVQVRRFIASLGMSIPDRWSGLPDHLSIELELMQRLADAEAGFWDARNATSAEDCAAHQLTFLKDHLAAWVPGLCRTVAARASTAFYREVARLTRTFVLTEIRVAYEKSIELMTPTDGST